MKIIDKIICAWLQQFVKKHDLEMHPRDGAFVHIQRDVMPLRDIINTGEFVDGDAWLLVYIRPIGRSHSFAVRETRTRLIPGPVVHCGYEARRLVSLIHNPNATRIPESEIVGWEICETAN